jgi:hypothetical protein
MSPEQNPNPQDVQVEALKLEVQRMVADDIKQLVATTEKSAQDVMDEDDAALDAGQLPVHEGDPANPNSLKAKAETSKRAVQALLIAAGDPAKIPGPDATQLPPTELADATQFARDTITSIAKNLKPQQVTENTAPYLHKLMKGLLDGTVKDVPTLKTRWERVRRQLGILDPTMAVAVRDSLVEVAEKQGVSKKEALTKYFQTQREADLQQDTRAMKENNNDKAIVALLEADPDAQELDCVHLYESLSRAQEFEGYYAELHRRKMADFDKGKTIPADADAKAAYENERNRFAAEQATRQIHRALIYMVNKFYQPVLVAAPDQDFKKTVSEFGDFYTPSPDQMYKQLFRKITGISSRGAAMIKDTEEKYMAFRQERITYYDPDQRVEITTTTPSKQLEMCNFNDFTRQLRKIVDTEQGLIAYGFDFRYATSSGGDPEKGFFAAIAKYAKENLRSGDIDEVNTMEYSELVQAAKLQMEPRYKMAFAKMGWKKSENLFREIFETSSRIDKEIRKTFIDAYGGTGPGKYSETIIDRCLFHARTELFGMNFMLHLMASYADPRLEKNGRPTYAGEEFAGASVFNASYDAIRWDVDDLYNNGELYLPLDRKELPNDISEAVEKGRDEFSASFQFGYGAFEESPPAIAEIANICKTGGVDAQGGWRLRLAYDNWLDDMLTDKTGNREMNMADAREDLLAQGWKRVENVGVNILKNYMESYLFTGKHTAALKDPAQGPQVRAKYESFFGFLHDRYFTGDSVGTAYMDGKSKNAYVADMMKLLESGNADGLKAATYNAMSVALFERTPIEFISMEKPRLTQNGVTLLSEVQDAFITAPSDSPQNIEQKKQFDDTVSDLIYVQQRARMDSVQEMEALRREKNAQGDRHNLYGDYGALRSEILKDKNGVGGYVVNEMFIENMLNDRYKDMPPAERAQRVKRSLDVYRKIKERVVEAPKKNREIDSWDPMIKDSPEDKAAFREQIKKNLDKKQEGMKNRMEWWSESWKSYRFGMTFSADTAGQFLDRNRTGADTTARAADFASNTAEVTKKAFLFGIKDVMKSAAIDHSFDPIYEYMRDLKNTLEAQDAGLAQDVMEVLGKRVINTFLRDKKALKAGGSLRDAVSGRAGSISETYTDEEDFDRPWSWDRNDVADFLEGAVGMTSGKFLEKEKAEALRKFGKASRWEIFRRHWLPVIGLSVVALVAAGIFAGMKEASSD